MLTFFSRYVKSLSVDDTSNSRAMGGGPAVREVRLEAFVSGPSWGVVVIDLDLNRIGFETSSL